MVINFVASADGTQIGYRRLGEGPGVVVLHGSMSSGYNHLQLAQALSDAFTVYLVDRRGRGLSGRYGSDHAPRREVEDLNAVLTHTGASNVFGVSVGAIIGLEAALSMPAIRKLAVYEPPLFADSRTPNAILQRFDQQMAHGRVAGALATTLKGARLGPEFINALPHRLLEFMTGVMLKREDKKGAGDYVSFRELAPTLHYETELIAQSSGAQQHFTELQAEVLLIGGSRSSRFLKDGLERLERAVPNVRRVELAGLDHSGSWNTNRGGNPQPVAAELRRFFASDRPAGES